MILGITCTNTGPFCLTTTPNHKAILAPEAAFKRFFKPLYLVRIISGRGRTSHERLFALRSSFEDWFVLPNPCHYRELSPKKRNK